MVFRSTIALAALCVAANAQTICPATPAFGICDIVFELPAGAPKDAAVQAEFRGPSHKTFLSHGFNSHGKLLIHFAPTEAGTWDLRVASNLNEFNGKQFSFTATGTTAPGFVEIANTHHFRYTGGSREAHIWIGDTVPEGIDASGFDAYLAARVAAGVNHLRLSLPGRIDEMAFDVMDARVAAMNARGVTADLVIAMPPGERDAREAYIEYVVDRLAARNVVWVLLDEYEKYPRAHERLREIAHFLDQDPYRHPRTVGASLTSAPFTDEKWMQIRAYRTADWALPAIEQMLFPLPSVNEFSGAGSVSGEAFRHALWNSSMSGAYPEAAGTDAEKLGYYKVWADLMRETRFWEMEPFFDAVGARGLAMQPYEFVIYVEKAQNVTVDLDRKHGWDVEWINPLNGERTALKKVKEENFSGAPPDAAHDWVLHISDERRKESMAKFVRFALNDVVLQEVEVSAAKIPFEIAQPVEDTLAYGKPVPYSVKLLKETRASKSMVYEWTGEVTADGENYRVLGTGAAGTFQLPEGTIRNFPATLHLRVYGLNALGKVYSLDRNFTVTK